MTDFKKEGANNNLVAKAEDKIRQQEAVIASMDADDPGRREALIILQEMRRNSAAIDFLRTLSHYDDEGD